MPAEMEDKRDELGSKFSEVFRQWLDPAAYPHVRFRDVEDARLDVVLHINQLVRENVIDPEELAGRQKQSPDEDANRIPS